MKSIYLILVLFLSLKCQHEFKETDRITYNIKNASLYWRLIDNIQEKLVYLIDNDTITVDTFNLFADKIRLDSITHQNIFQDFIRYSDILEIEMCIRGTNFRVLSSNDIDASYLENILIEKEVELNNPNTANEIYSVSEIGLYELYKHKKYLKTYNNVIKYNKEFLYQDKALVDISIFTISTPVRTESSNTQTIKKIKKE